MSKGWAIAHRERAGRRRLGGRRAPPDVVGSHPTLTPRRGTLVRPSTLGRMRSARAGVGPLIAFRGGRPDPSGRPNARAGPRPAPRSPRRAQTGARPTVATSNDGHGGKRRGQRPGPLGPDRLALPPRGPSRGRPHHRRGPRFDQRDASRVGRAAPPGHGAAGDRPEPRQKPACASARAGPSPCRCTTTIASAIVRGRSPKMRTLMARLSKAARSDVSVLLLGETGVGKEVFANALHDLSARRVRTRSRPSTAARSPQNLVASELFGHERGAFTGRRRPARRSARARARRDPVSRRGRRAPAPALQVTLARRARASAVPPHRREGADLCGRPHRLRDQSGPARRGERR